MGVGTHLAQLAPLGRQRLDRLHARRLRRVAPRLQLPLLGAQRRQRRLGARAAALRLPLQV